MTISSAPRGIVLMGGRSTRFPNKLFLSTRNGVPLFVEALDLLVSLGLDTIALCVNPSIQLVVREILENIRPNAFDRAYFELDSYNGIVPVLNKGLQPASCVVVCGDNVYGKTTVETCQRMMFRWEAESYYTSYCVCSNVVQDGLDGYNLERRFGWVSRSEPRHLALRTPWFLSQGAVDSKDLLSLLMNKRAEPIMIEDQCWSDLGTPESVERYYSEKDCHARH